MQKTYRIANICVEDFTIESLNAMVKKYVDRNEKIFIANHNLHSLYLYQKDKRFRKAYQLAKFSHIDGAPLIWWAKALGYNMSIQNRITYLDWIHPLLKLANDNSWKIFYLGAKPGVAEKAISKIYKSYKDVTFKYHHGFFNHSRRSEDNKNILMKINGFKPDLLIVGMGMPKQEIWIEENYCDLKVNVILNSGACFDYLAREVKTPPRWIGKYGLEWLYRFINEPKRLFKRYFWEPLFLIAPFFNDLLQSKRD